MPENEKNISEAKLSAAAKRQIMKILNNDGYRAYAEFLSKLNVKLVDPKVCMTAQIDNKGTISINRTLNADQVSVIVRHEILHLRLDHFNRLYKWLEKHPGKEPTDPLARQIFYQMNNVAADMEISNRGYTTKDKRAIRSLMFGDEILSGIVTEDEYPDWVDLTFEEMFDRLLEIKKNDIEEAEKLSNQIKKSFKLDKDDWKRIEQQIDDMRNQNQQNQSDGEQQKRNSPVPFESGPKNQSREGKSDEKAVAAGNSNPNSGDSNVDGTDDSSNNELNKPSKDASDKESNNPSNDASNNGSNKPSNNVSNNGLDKPANNASNNGSNKPSKDASNNELDKLSNDAKEGAAKQDKLDQKESDPNTPFKTAEEVEEEQRQIANFKKILSELRDLEERMDQEDQEAISSEQRQRALEKARKPAKINTTPIQDDKLDKFRLSLNKFIYNEVEEEESDTYSKANMSYEGSGIIMPGHGYKDRSLPLINVYWDMSGSFYFSPEKTKAAEQAIATLQKYVRAGKIKMNVYYHGDEVTSERPDGPTGNNGSAILEHIQATKPSNVIVISDGDIDCYGPNTVVPGAVWMIFYNDVAYQFINNLRGKKLTRVFRSGV